ncbi:MAG: transcription/translation regulatory transformer protein RfaH [Pseudohongiellaceae bacterium]|nr:transcription/translation regulatory transformer protein RfaH [Pseudohongiellaceae bacterium]
MTPQWYLLQCKTQQVQRAQSHLDNQGFEFYCPLHPQRKVLRGKVQTVHTPLFPGYLFIRLDDTSNWRSLSATRGVTKLVSFNGKPHPVPDALIEGLRQRLEQQEATPVFKPGEKVMVQQGAFKHIEAIVKAVTPDERIIVLLNILQSEQAVAFAPQELAKAG